MKIVWNTTTTTTTTATITATTTHPSSSLSLAPCALSTSMVASRPVFSSSSSITTAICVRISWVSSHSTRAASNADDSCLFLRSILAPRSISNSTTSVRPTNAAEINAVPLSSPRAFTSAPRSSSTRTASTWPSNAATIRGVLPLAGWRALISAPASSCRSIASTSPTDAASQRSAAPPRVSVSSDSPAAAGDDSPVSSSPRANPGIGLPINSTAASTAERNIAKPWQPGTRVSRNSDKSSLTQTAVRSPTRYAPG